MSISPLRQDLRLSPGQADKIDVTLKNITGGPITAKVSIQDFESDNATGNPKIITNSNFKNPASIRNFLVGIGNVLLATGEQKTFSIPVQVPANASPGAYYGLLEYQAVPAGSSASNNNQVALSAAVSQLVFITVPGVINQRLQINAIHVYSDKDATKEGAFFTHPPQQVGVEIHNFGNAFATPFGTVTLTKSGSSKPLYSYQLNGNVTRSLILPNSSRIFKSALKNVNGPGRYSLTVSASYGPGSTILTAKKTFWYIQSWLLIVIIAVIITLILTVAVAWRRYKRPASRHYKN